MAWTVELDEHVICLFDAGLSAQQISVALRKEGVKKTRNAVLGRLHRIKKRQPERIKRAFARHPEENLKSWTDEEDLDLLAMAKTFGKPGGWSWPDISLHFKTSIAACQRRHKMIEKDFKASNAGA